MNATPRRLSAVVFDLDGVIVDTARLHFLAWKKLADHLSLPFDEGMNEALKGVHRLGSLELLLGSASQRYSAAEKQELAELKNRWYVQSLVSIDGDHLLPGARDALDQVGRAGLKRALASASRNATIVLDRLDLTNQFDVIVDPSGIANGKPAPDIFLAAAAELDVEPRKCLGIEDAPAGVAGLRAAGMAVIGVGDPDRLDQADWVIPDLTHFRLDRYRSAA